jgi:hypothetical protein
VNLVLDKPQRGRRLGRMPGTHVHLLHKLHDISLFNVLGTNRHLGIAYDKRQAVAGKVFVEVVHVDATV